MMGELANHLWQSTVFAVAAGLLAVAFLRHQARVQPFVEDWSLVASSAPSTIGRDWIGLSLLGVWALGVAAIVILRFRLWQRVRAAVRASTPWSPSSVQMPAHAQLRAAPGLMEPGIVGWWRPILLVPAGIEDHLTPRQLAAVLAHEGPAGVRASRIRTQTRVGWCC